MVDKDFQVEPPFLMTIILTANVEYQASSNKNNRVFFFKFDVDTLTITATRGKIHIQFVKTWRKLSFVE